MSDTPATAGPDIDETRRKFLTMATGAVGGVGVVLAAVPFVESWQPSERARALGAPVVVDISKLETGQMIVATWRKQVIYISAAPKRGSTSCRRTIRSSGTRPPRIPFSRLTPRTRCVRGAPTCWC